MRQLRIVLAVALVAALLVPLAGCSDKDTAAKVNGEKIPMAELDKQMEQMKKQYPDMFKGADGEGRLLDFKQRLLDNLIDQELVRQAATAKGIKVSDAEIDTQIKQLKAGFGDDAQFEQALSSAGLTAETLKDQLREQLLTQQLITSLSSGKQATEAEIKEYYEANKAQYFQKAAKRASHILFKEDDEKTAREVLGKLKDGSDFATLAKRYSTDSATAAKGGDLGWPTTPYVAEFEAALEKLDQGDISDLVKSTYGWHIIKVTEVRKASQQSLADVSDQISQILSQQSQADAYQTFLEDLRAKADIEILVPELKQASTKDAKTETK